MFVLHCPSQAKHDPVTHAVGHIGVPHVEKPRRAECILKSISSIEGAQLHSSEREATDEELLSIHDAGLINFVSNAFTSMKEDEPQKDEVVPEIIGTFILSCFKKVSSFVGSIANGVMFKPKKVYLQSGHYAIDVATPIGEHTATQARKSAALAIDGAKQLLENPTTPVVAVCRPPGHHATREKYGGYCYYNNAALAAEVLKGNGLVCIFDIDYHHGNGTQSIFYERDDVMYISIHADPGTLLL
jgi:acetoin utilization deacetylase AcuC-like enzyme